MEEDLDEWYWFEGEDENEEEAEACLPCIETKRKLFLDKFQDAIIKWARLHENELLNYRSYRWKHATYEESVKMRNELEEIITISRKRNDGGLGLHVLDRIYQWGFGKDFPLRNEQYILKITKKAFKYLDQGNCYNACRTLMQMKGVGVAGATKILGLSNQNRFCIYDSRVGKALKDLQKDERKIIRCPPGRCIKGDYIPYERWDHEWALNYQKLIWTLEIIRDCLKEKDPNLRVADIEMALFMKGRS